MMKRYIALAALMAAIGSPAAAQQMMAPGASMASPMAALTPETFRAMAMITDTFEIESGRLALERSRNPRVRSFAEQTIQDHTMTSQALMGGARVAGVGTGTGVVGGAVIGGLVGGPVGAVVGAGVGATTAAATGAGAQVYAAGPTLDARHADMLNRLAAARGTQFDRLYGQMQVMAHREAVGLFSTYAQAGTDPNLRTFAGQVLPHLEHHLAMARSLPGAAAGRARRS